MVSERCDNFIHWVLLGPYYVLEDRISARGCENFELGTHTGQVAVVTGGHRGIGGYVTKDLLNTGMHVILGCRDVRDGERHIKNLREKEGVTAGKATVLPMDLGSFDSVRAFSEKVLTITNRIDFIINNAGIINTEFKLSQDNIELQWQVNYLGHFLLVHLLLPTLQATSHSKVISVSSLEHVVAKKIDYTSINKKENFIGQSAYGRSKAAVIMFSYYLNKKLKSINSQVEAVAVHPGIVDTEIFDDTFIKKYFPFIPRLFFKSPEKGAKPIVYAALHGKGGQYIGNCAPQASSSFTNNESEQQRLFEESKRSLQIQKFGNLF